MVPESELALTVDASGMCAPMQIHRRHAKARELPVSGIQRCAETFRVIGYTQRSGGKPQRSGGKTPNAPAENHNAPAENGLARNTHARLLKRDSLGRGHLGRRAPADTSLRLRLTALTQRRIWKWGHMCYKRYIARL